MFDMKERFTAIVGLGAGWILWLLVALSVIGVAVAIERAIRLVASSVDGAALRDALFARLRDGDVVGARSLLEASTSYEARIAKAGIEALDQGADSVDYRLRAETAVVRHAMERNLSFLGTLGSNAPFVGLLGTVIGIVRAFRELDASHGQVSAGLMSEIGEALVATAVGLLVALPAVAFFNYFHGVVRSRLVWASAIGDDLIGFASRTPKIEREVG